MSNSVLDVFKQFLNLEKDVLVLSIAMFAFSLGFQMTSRYMSRYLSVLGAGAIVIGAFGSFGQIISAFYPYLGGKISDKIGSRKSLTFFGATTSLGFFVWLITPEIGDISFSSFTIPVWIWVFAGLFLSQAWSSLGLGATFAIVKQSVSNSNLTSGFASTETFRRIGFLLGPLIAAFILVLATEFETGFQVILAIGLIFSIIGTVLQYFLYGSDHGPIGEKFEGVYQILKDLGNIPKNVRPLLFADIIIRFANGMAYVFFIIVVTEVMEIRFTGLGLNLNPDAFFGLLIVVEMSIALLTMLPVSRLAEKVGLRKVVAFSFIVYSLFPILLINSPRNQWVLILLFAFSGLRFAGLPSHKALIVGAAEENTEGRVTGTYYFIRNTIGIPSGFFGGWIYSFSPNLSFTVASIIGIIGTSYFLIFGEKL